MSQGSQMNNPLMPVVILSIIGTTLILATGGIVAGHLLGRDPPPALIAIVFSCLGYLGGLLTPVPISTPRG